MTGDYERWLAFGHGVEALASGSVELLPDLPGGCEGLHLGCGSRLLPGAVNVDWVAASDGSTTVEPGQVALLDGRFVYWRLDLGSPVDLGERRFAWAFAEHVIEHLRPDLGLTLLKGVRRALKPTGTLRVSTPDLARYVAAYRGEDARFFDEHAAAMARLGAPAMPRRRAWMMNQIFHFWGHEYVYDETDLTTLLVLAGFSRENVRPQPSGSSRQAQLAGCDAAERAAESLILEAWT